MSETTKIRLWFARETDLARLYCKIPPERRTLAFIESEMSGDFIWIPKSIIEHTSKEPSGLHIVTLPDWFLEKNQL